MGSGVLSCTEVEEEPDITVVSATVPATQPAASDAPVSDSTRPWLRPVWLGIAASIPLIVGAVIDAVHGWLPTGDDATIVLRARDVFSGHMPLVGQYTELSVYTHHATFSPGPMLYWLLTIPAQTTRWWPAAPLVWMALVQSVVVIAIVWMADRLGGRVLAVGSAIGIIVLAGSVGPRLLYDPWSADAPILPLVLLTLLAAAVVAGDDWLLPLVALIASFEVQADPSFVVVTALLCALATAAWAARSWRARSVRWATVGLTIGVVVVCWLPAVIQQLTTSPGNLTLLARGARHPGPREGIGFGLTILAKAVVAWPLNRLVDVRLQGGAHVSTMWIVAGLAVLAVLAGLALWAARCSDRAVAALGVTTVALAVGVVAAASAIPDDQFGRDGSWLLAWSRAAAMVIWVVAIWGIWRLWGQRVPARWLAIPGAAVVAVGALGVATIGRTPDHESWSYPAVREVGAMLEHRAGRGPYAVSADMWKWVPLIVGQGVIERLDARGYRIGANNGFEHNLGVQHRVPRGSPDIILTGDPLPNGLVPSPPFAKQAMAIPVDFWEYGHKVVVRVSLRESS